MHYDRLMPKRAAARDRWRPRDGERRVRIMHYRLASGEAPRAQTAPARPSDRREGGQAPALKTLTRLGSFVATSRTTTPTGGELRCHQRGEKMATSGEKKWPRMGSSRWPLTLVPGTVGPGSCCSYYPMMAVDSATAPKPAPVPALSVHRPDLTRGTSARLGTLGLVTNRFASTRCWGAPKGGARQQSASLGLGLTPRSVAASAGQQRTGRTAQTRRLITQIGRFSITRPAPNLPGSPH
jgi:hypothetical protein